MRLDHVSYVASHDQISDVVNRIGSQIGTAFVDGGIHPKFGTRNFTAPLLNGQYIEVVCPLDHPATDTTPFGRAVKKKVNEGGGWLSWVISTNDIAKFEKQFNRLSVIGNRRLPNGSELEWKQLGVLALIEDPASPFFIEWQTKNHPSQTGVSDVLLKKITLVGDKNRIQEWLGTTIQSILNEVEFEFLEPSSDLQNVGIEEITFAYKGNTITIN